MHAPSILIIYCLCPGIDALHRISYTTALGKGNEPAKRLITFSRCIKRGMTSGMDNEWQLYWSMEMGSRSIHEENN